MPLTVSSYWPEKEPRNPEVIRGYRSADCHTGNSIVTICYAILLLFIAMASIEKYLVKTVRMEPAM